MFSGIIHTSAVTPQMVALSVMEEQQTVTPLVRDIPQRSVEGTKHLVYTERVSIINYQM